MKKYATKIEGKIQKGNIAQIKIPAVKTTKVNRGIFTHIIIEKIIYPKNILHYYVACK